MRKYSRLAPQATFVSILLMMVDVRLRLTVPDSSIKETILSSYGKPTSSTKVQLICGEGRRCKLQLLMIFSLGVLVRRRRREIIIKVYAFSVVPLQSLRGLGKIEDYADKLGAESCSDMGV